MSNAANVFTNHIDDILGRGRPKIMEKVLDYLTRRIGATILREAHFTHNDAELRWHFGYFVGGLNGGDSVGANFRRAAEPGRAKTGYE